MQWLRMIPSEEARQTKRGVQRYFKLMGESMDISDWSEDDEDEEEDSLEDEDDDDDDVMQEEEGPDIVGKQDFANHE